MSKTAVVTTRIEPELKAEVEAVLSDLGLTVSQAILLYFKQIARQRAIPFNLEASNTVAYQAEQRDHILAEAGVAYLVENAGISDSIKSLLSELVLEKYGKSVSPPAKKQNDGKRLSELANIASSEHVTEPMTVAEGGASYLLSIAGMFDSGHEDSSENVKDSVTEYILEKYDRGDI